jgi:hypothetical protein
VAFLTIEQDLLVTSATTTSMDLLIRGVSSHLDDITDSLNHGRQSRAGPKDVVNEPLIEQLKADVANLGYAVALIKQLRANLVSERLESLDVFRNIYLYEKTPYQALRDIDINDIVELLFELLIAAVEDLALMGPIKKILEISNKKRERRADFEPGDTDIMFELDEIVAIDATRIELVLSALTRANTYAETLRVREAAAGKS